MVNAEFRFIFPSDKSGESPGLLSFTTSNIINNIKHYSIYFKSKSVPIIIHKHILDIIINIRGYYDRGKFLVYLGYKYGYHLLASLFIQ